MNRVAVVLGATGLVGARVLAHLTASTTYDRVVALVRRKGAIAVGAKTVEERVVDFDALDLGGMNDALDVYCALGTTMKKAGSQAAFRAIDHDLPLRVLDALPTLRRVALVSSVGADRHARSFYLRTKGELEDAVASRAERQGWGAVHVAQPSFLVGQRSEERFGEKIGIAVSRVVRGALLGGLRVYKPIEADVVAHALVAATTGPDPRPAFQRYTYETLERLATMT